MRSFLGLFKPALCQVIAREQFGNAYPDAIGLMKDFPCVLELSEAILAHAYVEPAVQLAEQRENVLCRTLSGQHHLETKYHRPWYELYDREKPVIVGHHDYLETGEPFIHGDRVFAIDTSCCHGGTLNGLILPGFRFVSVRARKDYWRHARQAYRATQGAAGHVKARRTLTQNDEDAARRVLDFIMRENLSVIARLRADNPGFDALPPTEQGRAYAAVVGDSKLAGLLHQARRGKLSLEDLRARIRETRKMDRLLGGSGSTRP